MAQNRIWNYRFHTNLQHFFLISGSKGSVILPNKIFTAISPEEMTFSISQLVSLAKVCSTHFCTADFNQVNFKILLNVFAMK